MMANEIMTKDEIIAELKNCYDYWTPARMEEFYGNRPPPNTIHKTWKYIWEVRENGIIYVFKGIGVDEKVVFELNDGTIYTLRSNVIPKFWDYCRNIYVESKLGPVPFRVEIPISNEQIEFDNKIWEFIVSSAPDNDIGTQGSADLLINSEDSLGWLKNSIDDITSYVKVAHDVTQKLEMLLCTESFCVSNRYKNHTGYYWKTCSGHLLDGFTSDYLHTRAYIVATFKNLMPTTMTIISNSFKLDPITQDDIDQLIAEVKRKCQP